MCCAEQSCLSVLVLVAVYATLMVGVCLDKGRSFSSLVSTKANNEKVLEGIINFLVMIECWMIVDQHIPC